MSEVAIFGIDVDAARLVMARFGSDGTVEVGNQPKAIGVWLRQIPAASRIGVESTSHYHQTVVRLAQAAGHAVYVLNPRDVRHYAKGIGRRGKTDRVDAAVIARYVAKEADQLHAHVPRTTEQQALHVLQQRRGALQRALTQLRQALTAHGTLPPTLRAVLNTTRAAVREVDRQIRALMTHGASAALFQRLMTVPGIGPVVAACLVQHLQRWPLAHVDAWVACTGLDPRPNDSGRKVGLRVLSKRGDATLRQMLYLAAMTFARHPAGKALATYYRHQRRFSTTATYTILARTLARLVWSLMRTESDFDLLRFTKDHRIELAT